MTGTAAYVLLKNKIDSASGGGGTVEYKAIKQLDTLPPTETTGTIVQYIGETNSDLTYGYFYRYNGTDWVNCLVQPMPPAPDGSAKISVSKSGYVTTVVAEDSIHGTTTVYITDGVNGVDGVDGITPTVSINSENHWVINSIDTGVNATGAKGDKGDAFSIDEKFDTTADLVAATDTVAENKMAIVVENKQLYIKISDYTDGEFPGWMEIGGIGDLTVIKGDKGDKGDDGVNGTTPTIDPETKHWMLGEYDTGVVAQGVNGTNGTNGVNGVNGITPTINSVNKHWMIGSSDTGILAEGFTPTIGINSAGHWVINSVDTGKTAYPIINDELHWEVNGVDTGIVGEGHTPEIDPDNKHWVINEEDTGILAEGVKGDKGDDGFSPTITQERTDNKVTLTINQITGTETVDIFDGLNAYNDTEVKERISDLEDAVEILNGDDTVEGSVEAKIVEAFSKFTSIKFEKVAELPDSGENGVFYLVPAAKTSSSNLYDEYIYIEDSWEFLGTTEIDLSAYAKKTELPIKVSDLTNDSGFITSSDLPGKASMSTLGLVRVDGSTIKIDSNGVISGSPGVNVSSASDNILTTKTDGLYVPPTNLSAYAKTADVPNKTSQLTNDGENGTDKFITQADVPTKLSEFTNDLIATTLKAGTVIPDGDTVTIDGSGTITATIGANSLSRDEGNQIELHEDGIYIGALNEDAIYSAIDAVDLASPILTEYTEDELYHLAWEEIEIKEKEEYTEEELDEILDGLDLSGIGGGGGDENIIESISVNGVDIPPDESKNIALTIMTNSVNDLVNYYKKTETYTKTEIDGMLSTISGGSFTVVASLPLTDIDTKTIYLVPKATSETSNVYDEFIYASGSWEKIGDTAVDLSGYVTTSAMTSALGNKQDVITGGTTGQILKKQSNTDGDFDWEDETVETQEISQADFDALSLEEKNNGIAYFISDGDGLINKTAMGYTPIGTVISVMGNTAPKHYLACDGSIVNILDYPELANYFNTQFGSKNYFGGDGVTTFAVPDLRGEFLRGTGTNSHENQGDGAAVGVHQDGTEHQDYNVASSGIQFNQTNNEESNINKDSALDRNYAKWIDSSSGSAFLPTKGRFTSRPTNTSVLYCIATKNIYIDPKNNYSTEEQVVGTWIDGKPIYQKTLYFSDITVSSTQINIGDLSNLNIDFGMIVNYVGNENEGYFESFGHYACWLRIPAYNIGLRKTLNDSPTTFSDLYITLQYTKTTD